MTALSDSPKPIQRKITLLVEGFHDASTIAAICESRVLGDFEFHIDQMKGLPRTGNRDSTLNAVVSTRLNEQGVTGVVLVVDADADLGRVQRRLHRLPILAGVQPLEFAGATPGDGYIGNCRIGDHRKRLGIWVMPDNRNPGQLEGFVLQMVPETDPVKQPAREFIGDLSKDVVDKASHKTTKHIAHAWLSAYYPGWSFDDALRNGQLVFTADQPALATFKRWLERLAS